MDTQDIRWVQRLSNFNKALSQLSKAVTLNKERPLTDLEDQGVIHAFEFTHELAWKTIKDFLEEKGSAKIYGSKDATREAFQAELILDGETWMQMIKSRNDTSQTYNEETADEIARDIKERYFDLFIAFGAKMKSLSDGI